jgi:hypothetical protein
LRSWPEMKNERTTLMVSGPMMLQALLKKPTLKPLGPGALLSLRENRTVWISSSVTRASRPLI